MVHKNKAKSAHKWLIGLAVLIVLIFVIALFMQPKKVSLDDIKIYSLQHDYQFSNIMGFGIYFDANQKLIFEYSFEITSNRDDLFVKVFDETDGTLAQYRETSQKLMVGDNKIRGRIYPRSLYQDTQLKICVATTEIFNTYTTGVLCKIETLKAPKFEYEITPSSLTFTISKKQYEYDTIYNPGSITEQKLKIKNIGTLPAPAGIYFPHSEYNSASVITNNYPASYPQYGVPQDKSIILPGETLEFRVSVQIRPWEADEFKTSTGTYSNTGYITGINSLFKKDIPVTTIVTP